MSHEPRNRDAVLKDWNDLISGLSLLYMGKDGRPDELVARALWHMEHKQVGGMEHVSALLMTQLLVRGTPAPKFAQKKWGELSREWHRDFCPDEMCVERRGSPDD